MFRVSFVRRGQDFGHLESPATQSFNLLMGVAENYMAYEGTEYTVHKNRFMIGFRLSHGLNFVHWLDLREFNEADGVTFHHFKINISKVCTSLINDQ